MNDPTPAAPSLAKAPRSRLDAGYRQLQQAQWDEARKTAEALVGTYPEDPFALVLASEVKLADNDPQSALSLLDQAIALSGHDAALRIKKAQLLLQMGQRIAAIRQAGEVADAVPDNGQALWRIGSIHGDGNDPAGAAHYFKRALACLGDTPGLLYDLAASQFFTGEFEDAERHLDRLLSLYPQAGHALYLRSTLRRQTGDSHHVDDLDARLKRGFNDPSAHAACLYALAKELEDLGEDQRAFTTLTQAARTMRSTLQYDVESECRSIQAVRETFSAEQLAAIPAAGTCDDDGAIFVVGMPRTGTTLVERILGANGEVAPAGELLDFGNTLASDVRRLRATNPGLSAAGAALLADYPTLGRHYMDTARQAAGGQHRFIDKMPVNYLYCGMIAKALPNARIIHLVRDPLDSCYAVYKTLFYGAYHFSYDLHELASYYIAYHRMMQHWHEAMPGRILDVHYENLVANTKAEAQRILAWCGLSADDPKLDESSVAARPFATASAAQVREPVHTRSVLKSRRHATGLAPLSEAMVAAGIQIR